MKTLLNKLIAYLWSVKHIGKAYRIHVKNHYKSPHLIREYPLAETPTKAIEMFLERVDGVTLNESHRQFAMICKREWEIRLKASQAMKGNNDD